MKFIKCWRILGNFAKIEVDKMDTVECTRVRMEQEINHTNSKMYYEAGEFIILNICWPEKYNADKIKVLQFHYICTPRTNVKTEHLL